MRSPLTLPLSPQGGAREARTRRRHPLPPHRRGSGGSRSGPLLQPAHHHPVVPAGVHPGGAGGTAVRTARLYQDLCHGGRGRPVGDADPGADGLLHPRPHPPGGGTTRSTACSSPLTGRCIALRAALSWLTSGGSRRWCWRRRSTRCTGSAASSCRRWTKAICSTCRRPCPASSAGKAAELLQQTDRIIKTVPGSAERVRQDRPRRDRHRSRAAGDDRDHHPVQAAQRVAARHDPGRLIAEMDARDPAFPGLSNLWVQPIRNRIDMLATGIKSPVGVKIAGADIQRDRPHRRPDRDGGEGRAGRDLGAGGASRRRALYQRAHRRLRCRALSA